jgi:hypothetical protein
MNLLSVQRLLPAHIACLTGAFDRRAPPAANACTQACIVFPDSQPHRPRWRCGFAALLQACKPRYLHGRLIDARSVRMASIQRQDDASGCDSVCAQRNHATVVAPAPSTPPSGPKIESSKHELLLLALVRAAPRVFPGEANPGRQAQWASRRRGNRGREAVSTASGAKASGHIRAEAHTLVGGVLPCITIDLKHPRVLPIRASRLPAQPAGRLKDGAPGPQGEMVGRAVLRDIRARRGRCRRG